MICFRYPTRIRTRDIFPALEHSVGEHNEQKSKEINGAWELMMLHVDKSEKEAEMGNRKIRNLDGKVFYFTFHERMMYGATW